MKNVEPLLALMDGKDKLAKERKVVETLMNKFGGRAKHSELMNACHSPHWERGYAIRVTPRGGAL
ncbi:MAG: hypothetical protein K0B87_05095 [Candidatus Syntrophosphaera sp.]|nr:hypothetical protein [Candidatus Syntrophosphaera sp.]